MFEVALIVANEAGWPDTLSDASAAAGGRPKFYSEIGGAPGDEAHARTPPVGYGLHWRRDSMEEARTLRDKLLALPGVVQSDVVVTETGRILAEEKKS
jgi:hypothetical protein